MTLTTVSHTTRTSSGSIKTGPGGVASVNICGGADAATVTLDDSTDGSGTVICKLGVAANASDSFAPSHPISVSKGIYATVTGTSPSVSVAFV